MNCGRATVVLRKVVPASRLAGTTEPSHWDYYFSRANFPRSKRPLDGESNHLPASQRRYLGDGATHVGEKLHDQRHKEEQ